MTRLGRLRMEPMWGALTVLEVQRSSAQPWQGLAKSRSPVERSA